MPKRIQLRRTKGWRKPPNTIVVSRPSKWGNPYVVERDGELWVVSYAGSLIIEGPTFRSKPEAAEWAVQAFERLLRNELRELAAQAKVELRGKNLACWCPTPRPLTPDFCHAAVLLRIANA